MVFGDVSKSEDLGPVLHTAMVECFLEAVLPLHVEVSHDQSDIGIVVPEIDIFASWQRASSTSTLWTT